MYTNIEYDLTTASRGNRNDYLTESMKVLLGVENVAFVNNNASSSLPIFTMPSKKT